MVTDINEAGAIETLKSLQGSERALAVKCDISRKDAVDALAKKALKECKHVDILVHAAGEHATCVLGC